MTAKRLVLKELSNLEQQVMEIVWTQGEVSALAVQQHWAHRHDLARNTVRTLLDRMEKKGWLKHRLAGRTFFYTASISREATMGRKVLAIVEQVCGNSPEQLMAALLDHRGLTVAELARIKEMLNQAKATRLPPKGK